MAEVSNNDAVIPPPPPGFELVTDIPPPPPGFVVEQAPAPTSKYKEELPSELNLMRRRLGMGETGTKEEGERGALSKAYDFMGGRTGIGATAGGLIGTALAPETGGLSLLIPALTAGAGGATGALTEGKSPIKEGLREGFTQGVFGGAAKAAKPAWQFVKESAMKTFGTREGVSEVAESLLKKWMLPATKAGDLYAAGEGLNLAIPATNTTRVVDDLVNKEFKRIPLGTQQEILETLKPVQKFYQPSGPFKVAQPVADMMAEVRRLRLEATRAFKADNSDLGNAINSVRSAMLDDMEQHGAGVVKEASRAYRKEMAIESLAEQISKPSPGIKLRDYARKNPLFDKAFDATEKAQIDRIVKKLSTVAPSGASGILGKVATSAAGAAIGGAGGESVLGGIVGYVAPEYIRTLLASPAGRNFMEKTLEGTYKMGGRGAASIGPVLSIFARGLMAGEPETETPQ